MYKKILTTSAALVALQGAVYIAEGSAAFDQKVTNKQTTVSPGVQYIQENYQSSSTTEVVNMLSVDLNNSYTSLEIGIPNPINSLKTTSAISKLYNAEGHRVVGATNASYFLGNGYPANLLVNNNVIVNYGILGDNTDSPTQQPVAFGMTKSGEAIADYYSTDLSFTVAGQKFTIDRVNNERAAGTSVLYTASQASTNTNNWGIEIVVTGASKSTKTLSFGDSITGTVASVTEYGQAGNSAIPEDGFVLSVQDKATAEQIKASIEVGSPIQVDLNIDDKWKDAQFILAAGPLLVKDGKVNISMPESSSFVKTRSDRTAIAVDATGKKVFLVTVDGRQSGYSNGASLTDLASYLILKGAKYAINLDGGGSTTMVVRQPGEEAPSLANRPSEGSERRVSATLQVINAAPAGTLKAFSIKGLPSTMTVETSATASVSLAYDEYLNPAAIQTENVKWTVEGGIGTMNGANFTATKIGSGKIVATYNGIRAEFPIQVTKAPEAVQVIDSFDVLSNWSSTTAKANATIAGATQAEPFREGTSSLKLSYDFTTADTGTKAAYAVAQSAKAIEGLPKQIGIWVYGDASKHWLRGLIVDGNGEKHTVDFTQQGKLDWTGWKYVTATVPQNLALPIKFDRIYVTEPNASNQNKGVLYFDQLQAVYKDNYKEPIYTDLKATHWASSTIEYLNTKELIKGYPNGTFKPESTITRAEAATIIARALDITKTKNITFSDVKATHFAYDAIAAVAEKGIITGREASKFSPDGKLTRAEMATILKRAYNLTGTTALPFKDVPSSHWAYEAIQTVYQNQLTGGYPDNTFKPNNSITRAEFATFLTKILQK
jgi:exopolysaccharide biosynthesis protein